MLLPALGRAGLSDANVVRWDVRSLRISPMNAGECQMAQRLRSSLRSAA
jgi:hypothetical protein